MNIIEMAKEAGFTVTDYYPERLKRFAALVRAERKWVDLTDDEVEDLATDWFAEEWAVDKAKGLIDDFLAKFKERNTPQVTPQVTPQGEPVAMLEVFDGWEDKCMVWHLEGAEKLPDGTYTLYTTPPSVEAAIEATKEKIAKWYDEEGYLLDEGDIAAAIRSMK